MSEGSPILSRKSKCSTQPEVMRDCNKGSRRVHITHSTEPKHTNVTEINISVKECPKIILKDLENSKLHTFPKNIVRLDQRFIRTVCAG